MEPKELKEGDRAPAIKLETDTGEMFDLAAHKGERIILYFYPRADTPGCTVEACEFRDSAKKIAKKGALIVGISPDTVKAQAKFKTKFDLPFMLLADADRKVAAAYGVVKEKNMYGKKVMGVARTTFIIGPDGKIEKIYDKVKAEGHAGQILEGL
jgi:peroxiredoxin Q/BCP